MRHKKTGNFKNQGSLNHEPRSIEFRTGVDSTCLEKITQKGMVSSGQREEEKETELNQVETTDESLYWLVFRVQVYCQYGPPNRKKNFLSVASPGLESAETFPENRLQRALRLIRNESQVLPPLTGETESEPQDEYASPYPFATRREYFQAVGLKSRTLLRSRLQSLK